MVATTFVEKPDEEFNIVNHLDGKKINNYYKNLEWTTPGGNTRHALQMGLQTNSGPNCPSAVYTEETVREICKDLESGMDCFEIYTMLTGDSHIENRAFYALIFSIKSGKRHREISKEYDIPNSVLSKQKKKFSKEEIDKIREMIASGCSNVTILRHFGYTKTKKGKGKRYYDKILSLRRQMEMCSTTRES